MLDNIRELISRLRRDPLARIATEADRDYTKPVGDPTGIGAAASGTTAVVRRKGDLEDWQLALALVDRNREAERLCERLQGLASAGAPRALLVILPCFSSDCHDYFLARCVTFDLKEVAHAQPDYCGWTWPETPSITRVIGNITERFQGSRLGDPKSLNDLLEKHGPPVCISYVLDGEHWKADQGKTLKEWTAIFAQGQLKPHKDRFFVAFLCFLMEQNKTEYCRRLEEIADAWQDEGPQRNPAVVVIRLPKVRQTQLADWRESAKNRLGWNIDFQFVSEINHIFKNGPVFMDDIDQSLRGPLQRLFAEQRLRVRPTAQP